MCLDLHIGLELLEDVDILRRREAYIDFLVGVQYL